LHLSTVHPGHSEEEIRENTGWDLKIAPDLGETPEPTTAEMDALHQIDKDGYWR
jgi:glutaconate CoA-transferase subunit B